MIAKIRNSFIQSTNQSGFTLMELCMVMAILGILAAIALKVFTDSRRHMADAAALAEIHGLGKAVLNTFIEGSDVDLAHLPGDGRQIGALDTSGNPRKPVFELSPVMQADITGNSDWGGSGNGYIYAELEHPLGTKMYVIEIDEQNAISSFPDF